MHIAADDYVDNSLSKRVTEESGDIELKSLAFKAGLNSECPLFHSSFDGGRALFSIDKFRGWVDGAGLQGLVFPRILLIHSKLCVSKIPWLAGRVQRIFSFPIYGLSAFTWQVQLC